MSADARIFAECQDLVRHVVGLARADCGNTTRAIEMAAARLGIGYSRVRKIWYGQANTISAGEHETLQRASVRIHREEEEKLRARLENEEAARRRAQHARRPPLQLIAPEAPRRQERLPL